MPSPHTIKREENREKRTMIFDFLRNFILIITNEVYNSDC